jgi:hypothetical protein
MPELDDVFTPLDPPTGGLEALHDRLRRRSQQRRRRLVAGGALAVAASALLFLRPAPAPEVDDPTWDVLTGRSGSPVWLQPDGPPQQMADLDVRDDVIFVRITNLDPSAGPIGQTPRE